MARKFLTALDLSKNELQNAVVQNLASAPSSPVKGQLYYDTTGNILYWWNGTAWVSASGGAGVTYGTITASTSFGQAKADGVATTVARSDHVHGTPTHVAADHSTISISALAVPTGDIPMAGFKLTNVGTPVNPGDAANKGYVDDAIAGLAWKEPAWLATTVNLAALSGLIAVDGTTAAIGDRILVKNQTTASANGIYLAASGAWTRTSDADSGPDFDSAAIFVQSGTTMADTAWVQTTNTPITVGTTSLVWTQFSGGATVTAGAGMTQSGNTLNVIAADATINVTADTIAVGSTSLTQSHYSDDSVTNAKLVNMPTLTIKGNDTGAAADPKDLTKAAFATMFAGTLGRVYSGLVGGGTTASIPHNFNTLAVAVEVWRNSTPWDTVECDIERTNANTVTLRFATAVSGSEYGFTVVG